MPKIKITPQEKLIDEVYRLKIRTLKPKDKVELSSFLGLAYFTLMGKVSGRGNFRSEHRLKLKEWFRNGKADSITD